MGSYSGAGRITLVSNAEEEDVSSLKISVLNMIYHLLLQAVDLKR